MSKEVEAKNPIEEPVKENKIEEPKVEENKIEEPKVEEPKVEKVKNKEPKVEEPKVEKVKNKEAKVVEAKVEKVKNKEKNKEVKSEKVKIDNNDDIFITEKDRFTLTIEYYLENKDPIIEGFNDSYSKEGKEVHSFDMYFKYPSQRDTEYIMSVKPIQSIEDAEVLDFIELENVRIMKLMRGWSMSRPLEDLAEIHPNIVKALRRKMSETIGGNGLF
jgi:hypothetical protein